MKERTVGGSPGEKYCFFSWLSLPLRVSGWAESGVDLSFYVGLCFCSRLAWARLFLSPPTLPTSNVIHFLFLLWPVSVRCVPDLRDWFPL